MLKNYILNFQENLQGLRDFTSLISPFLDEHGEKVNEKHIPAFEPLNIARKRHFAKTDEEREKYSEELRLVFDGEIETYEKETEEEISDKSQESDELKKKTKNGIRFKINGDTDAIDEAFKELAKTQFHKELLYKNSLISLLSTVEWFFSQILHFYYDKYPDAAGIKNKTLTLDDLKNFVTVKDAENYLIENKIEDVLRGSLKDWFKILKDEIKLGLGYKDNFEDDLVEVYQRRNLLVHNGGIINSIYISKVSGPYKDLTIGDKIKIDKEYLESAIDKFELVFTLAICELWKKINENDEARAEILMQLGYRFLKEQKWNISESTNYFLCGDKKMPVANRTAAQLNVWLCKKESKGYEDVRKEIEQNDYSDKSLIFQIALASLKDDKDFFFNNIEQALRTEELLPEHLLEFPIFKNMRELDEFEKFVLENEKMKEYNLN